MKSKKGAVLGSFIGTIIAIILIVGILISFVFISTILEQFEGRGGIFIDEQRAELREGETRRDDKLGIVSQNQRHLLVEDLRMLFTAKSEEYTFLEAIILLNSTNKENLLGVFESSTFESYIEIIKGDVTIRCLGGMCVSIKSEHEKFIKFFDNWNLRHEYIKLELSETKIIISSMQFNERNFLEGKYGQEYCIYLGGGSEC